MLEHTHEDFQTFYRIARRFWQAVPDEAYDRQTGNREKDWTLHETLAHLLAIAQLLNRATNAALRNAELVIQGSTRREDLAAWNAKEIARLSQAPPNALIMRFLQELEQAGNIAHTLREEQSQQRAFIRFYNRPARVIDFIDWQLSHAAVIHAAQVTRPLAQEPLWQQYPQDFTQRTLDRYLRHFSMAYWQEYGPDQAQIINFHIGGKSGGDWHIVAAPDGGTTGYGAVDAASYDIFFDSAASIFGAFTLHESFKDLMLSGRLRFASDFRETMALVKLFTPGIPT